ncbi:MAG: hypothetical protein ACW99F_17480, partial [Candidatus Hodarchaeales archaeon]
MGKKENPETHEDKPLNETSGRDKEVENKGFRIFETINSIVPAAINRLIPIFEPRIEIEKKLVPNEIATDNAIIRHYEELQILIGFLILIFGLFAGSIISLYAYLFLLLGFLLVITGFDIEEIYITNKRMLIRHIGFVERIIRIPSDEEHLLEHVVSFTVGRAPMNALIVFLGGSGFFVLLSSDLGVWTQFVVVLVSIA